MRTLVARRRYFGVDAIALQQSAYRVLGRVVGLPLARAHVSSRQLRQDFGVDTREGRPLAARLVAGGLLKPHPVRAGDFEVLPRMAEFATARVVEPMSRTKAKRLLERACAFADRFNRERSRNPLAILAIAPFGEYLANRNHLARLTIGVVVTRRPPRHMSRWRAPFSDDEGAAAIHRAVENLSSFVKVVLTEDTSTLPRPFSVAWQDPTL